MGSQFFTAVGAFVGTFLGIWIAETSGTGKGVVLKEGQGLFGSSVAGGDLVIPMTAGGMSSYLLESCADGKVSCTLPVSVSSPSYLQSPGVVYKL
jgi:hypothetical protein